MNTSTYSYHNVWRNVLLSLCSIFLLTHCERWKQETPQVLKPYDYSQLNYHVSPIANTYAFLFYSSEDWTAVIACAPDATEVLEKPSVFPASGSGSQDYQAVNFTVPENHSLFDQTYYLTLVSKEKILTVVIRQRADLGTLKVTPTEILLPSSGGGKVLHIESNKDWAAQTEDNWFTLSQTSGRGNQETDITVSADHNKTVFRTSTILFQSNNKTCPVTVSQHAFFCTLPTTTSITHEGPQTIQFSITSSLPWTLTATNSNWYTLETVSHQASEEAFINQITFPKNTGSARTTKLTLTNTHNETQIFTITQTADIASLFQTNWSGTATVQASEISQTGSMDLTIVDENNVIVKGFPGEITYFSNESITFRVAIDQLTYNGITGHNIVATFTGSFSQGQTVLSGTLTGSATVLGLSVTASGTWRTLLSM